MRPLKRRHKTSWMERWGEKPFVFLVAGGEASHLRSHEASPFTSAVQLVCVPTLGPD